MDSSFITIAIVGVLSPFVIQLAKNSQLSVLSWINKNKPRVCVIVNAATALLTNAGIVIHHSVGQITITYPDLPTIMHGVLVFLVGTAVQFGGQHAVYEGLVRHLMPSPVAAAPVAQDPPKAA